MGRTYRRGESFLLVRHGRPSAVRPQVRSGCAVFSVGFVLAIWAITTIRGAGTRVETGALTAGKAAYAMAKLGPSDIDAVELYDAFTINTILFLEDLGFCKKGEGGAFVSGGRIGPNGSLAVNTISYCHPGMYGLFLLIEAVRQLRGECGGRQVKNCEVALAHGNGGVLSSQATVILGTQATL